MNISYFGLLGKLHCNFNQLTIDFSKIKFDCDSINDLQNIFHEKVYSLELKCASVEVDNVALIDITHIFSNNHQIYIINLQPKVTRQLYHHILTLTLRPLKFLNQQRVTNLSITLVR